MTKALTKKPLESPKVTRLTRTTQQLAAKLIAKGYNPANASFYYLAAETADAAKKDGADYTADTVMVELPADVLKALLK
jgi:hypothetical protein